MEDEIKPGRQIYWWEEYLVIDVVPYGMRANYTLLLYDLEIGKFVAGARTLAELDRKAETYFFEKLVLGK